MNRQTLTKTLLMLNALAVMGLPGRAQEAPPDSPSDTGEVLPLPVQLPPDNPAATTRERPVIIPPKGPPEETGTPPRPAPPVPGRSDPSEAMKDLVREFQLARKTFLSEQKELLQNIQDATSEQRAMIRSQLRDNLNEWLQEQKAQIKEMRDQAKQIQNSVPALREVIGVAGGEGRDR